MECLAATRGRIEEAVRLYVDLLSVITVETAPISTRTGAKDHGVSYSFAWVIHDGKSV